jgi:hypothetical protein
VLVIKKLQCWSVFLVLGLAQFTSLILTCQGVFGTCFQSVTSDANSVHCLRGSNATVNILNPNQTHVNWRWYYRTRSACFATNRSPKKKIDPKFAPKMHTNTSSHSNALPSKQRRGEKAKDGMARGTYLGSCRRRRRRCGCGAGRARGPATGSSRRRAWTAAP